MFEKIYFTVGSPIYPFKLANQNKISKFFHSHFIPTEASSMKMVLRKHIPDEEFVQASRVGKATLVETEDEARLLAQSRRIYHRQCFDDYSEPAVYEARFFYSRDTELPIFQQIEISTTNTDNPLHKLGIVKLNVAELEDHRLTFVGGSLKIISAENALVREYKADGGELLVRNHPRSCVMQ